ncbi:MAG: DUF4445 domain-containing protein [Hyphomicrobiaceae bacterium]|nr:DUF4445 domain-containing protein [Hyphomicrobiaceae bacterium]
MRAAGSALVTFAGREGGAVAARLGESLLAVARHAGVEVTATCGERGRCRSCRVKILEGQVPPATLQDEIQLGRDGVREHFRLACLTKVIGNCSVMVAPPRSEAGHQILGGGAWTGAEATPLDSGVEKHVVTAKAASGSSDPTSDAEAIAAALGETRHCDFPLDILRRIPSVLRADGGILTVTTFNGEVIDIEPGDTSSRKFGVAFDIGTTTVVGTLIDLSTGEQLASVRAMNPQAIYGGDVLSRIAYAQFDEKKLARLRASVLKTVNDLITEACREAGVAGAEIYKAAIVGNTCMHHIFLGIDPSNVGLAPYNPVVRSPLVAAAAQVLLKAAPRAIVCLLPIVAGFVGADTVAAVLATRLHESDACRLLVDIGTNGEIVLAVKGRLVACSAPAGPTFEGGQVQHGMRAAVGAIEGVDLDDDVSCRVIGDAPAIGICGSGLIDAAARLRDAGFIDASGMMGLPEGNRLSLRLKARFRERAEGSEVVLVGAAGSGNGEDITVTQGDVRQLQLAKAAIHAGIMALKAVMGISNSDLQEVVLAGGFGNYLNVESAIRIGLLPALPAEKISYVGNAALTGAQLALVSEQARNEALAIAQRIDHVELADHPQFEEHFVAALSFAVNDRRELGEEAVCTA